MPAISAWQAPGRRRVYAIRDRLRLVYGIPVLRPHGDGLAELILTVLSLIDLSLALNLVMIVIFSGYENFVSKIDTGGSEDRPQWMGTLDFSGLKMKLIGSIVAISAISLLRAFMELVELGKPFNEQHLRWMVILHVTFLASGVLFALMDYIASLTEKNEHDIHPNESRDERA